MHATHREMFQRHVKQAKYSLQGSRLCSQEVKLYEATTQSSWKPSMKVYFLTTPDMETRGRCTKARPHLQGRLLVGGGCVVINAGQFPSSCHNGKYEVRLIVVGYSLQYLRTDNHPMLRYVKIHETICIPNFTSWNAFAACLSVEFLLPAPVHPALTYDTCQ